MKEWKDFGEILKKNIKETKNGIYIDNEVMDDIEAEADDVAAEYEGLEGSEWDKAYKAGFKAAFESKQAQSVERRMKTFKKSKEHAALKKELKDLDKAIKKNLEVTDIPEEWKHHQNMLKIKVTDHEAIEEEWDDVEETWNEIKGSKPVRNLGKSLKRWGESEEVDDLKELDKKFYASERGQRLVHEWEDVFKALDETVYHNEDGIYINNEEMKHLGDELEDVGDEYKDLETTHWKEDYDAAFKAAFSNKEAASVGRRGETFKKSKEGMALKKEMKEFKQSLKDNIEVSDVPEDWKKNMFLF